MEKLAIVIVVFAFLIRVAGLDFIPPSLNWDEVSHGYNAYSILKTGKDEWGVSFPAIFRAYGDYKLPVYIYLTTISEAFFGLNEFAVRLPSVVAGTLSVLFTYLLVKELFKKSSLATISALLMAIEPWSFFLSRVAVEANLASFFIISGAYLFLIGLRKKGWLLPISAVLFGLSVWTYNSARIFVPLLLIALIVIYRKDILKILKSHKLLVSVSCLLITFFFLPMLFQLFGIEGQARYGEVKILDQGTIAKIIENRNSTNLPSLLPRVIHNKATYFIVSFIRNYFSHFSPNFLYLRGGTDYQFNVQNHGLLYLVNLPFLLVGLLLLLKDIKKTRASQLVFSWILLAPIASSLTREAPHVLRDIVFLPIPMLLTAAGLIWFINNQIKFRKILMGLYLFVLTTSNINYLFIYTTDYRTTYSWSWQYGYKEMVSYVRKYYDKYDKIIVTKKYGEPHEFFLFYWPWDPEKYRSDPNLIRFSQSKWFWVDRFDKFYFVNDWDIPEDSMREKVFVLESGGEVDCRSKKCLLISDPKNFPITWNKLGTVNFLDGKTAFKIYENQEINH